MARVINTVGRQGLLKDSLLAYFLIAYLLPSLDLVKYLSRILSMPVHMIPLV